MVTPAPTEQEAASLGLTVEEGTPVIDIWPENFQSVSTFRAVLTQWRVGMSGAVGLDYAVLRDVMRWLGVEPECRAGVFRDVRVMEAAALEAMRETK